MKLLGLLLILLGVVLMATQGFTFKTKEKIVDTDKLQISKTETKSVIWPLYAGGLLTVAGIAVLIAGGGKLRRDLRS